MKIHQVHLPFRELATNDTVIFTIKIGLIFICAVFSSCGSSVTEEKNQDQNSSLEEIGQIRDGKKVGLWVYYASEDTLKKEYYLPNGELGFVVEYSKNKPLVREDFYHGQLVKKSFYHENGILKSETYFEDTIRHGKQETYFVDGTLRTKAFFKNDTPHGEFYQYYNNGNIEVYSQDIEKGIFLLYDSLGNLHDTIYQN